MNPLPPASDEAQASASRSPRLEQTWGPLAGHVYLTGAGPGDPGLLTLRAAHLIAHCEVILPDDLVSPEILALASPAAKIIPVGKRCGQPRITQAGIHALMLEHAQPPDGVQPGSVLRLKSGDPLVFGRAQEEIAALRSAGVPFHIIPGITAAFAAAATLRTPLTARDSAAQLVLATAHHAAGRPAPASLVFPPGSTIALYMPGRDLSTLAQALLDAGHSGDTPVAVISRVSTPHQAVVSTTIAGLPGTEPGPAPLLLLIGEAVQPITL